jgi:cytochrome P450
MTNADDDAGARPPQPTAQPTARLAGAGLARSAETGEWIASRYADVQAILADHRFEVPAAEDTGAAIGTISWLRAAVSRFANGTEHERRRARVIGQLSLLDPDELRGTAGERTRAVLDEAGQRGDRIDVMALLARPVPMAAMAAMLGIADPDPAAAAVIAIAAGYFGGPDERVRQAADAATARLVDLLGVVDLDVKVARITLMAQACDATAGLVGGALHVLQDAPDAGARWPTDAVLSEVLRYSPPVRASRRVARSPVEFGADQVSPGDTVVCSVDSANRDPAVFDQPDRFEPARNGPPSLTFGYGVRPCPGQSQALMLAAGVVDCVRERCAFSPGEPVEYLPSSPLRIPRRLEVVLR